jgi:Xaa-Pro aminopeptidase
MNLAGIQGVLSEHSLHGWLFFDHHQRDQLAYRVLGLHPETHVTRRWYYFIPCEGEPTKLVHRIESGMLENLPGRTVTYARWEEHLRELANVLRGAKRVAMQYSPNCAIPVLSLVDGGTVELIRSLGIEVVTSASLIQYFEAQLDQDALDTHLGAGKLVDQTRSEAFQFVAERLRAGVDVGEFEVADFVRELFRQRGLISMSGPIVAVDAHAADPHYEPTRESSVSIRRGSLVLLDMWAKVGGPNSIYYDITWTGFCGDSVPEAIGNVFDVVINARNAAIYKVERAVEHRSKIRGFEVDDAARTVIQASGFGDFFVHRTGHSIGREVHGSGANMDNFETHDDREIIPWSCFSIEPGVYLKDFGIRSEINMFVTDQRALVTGERQDALVRIG